MNVLIVAYSVDKNDISESQMAYEWISRLSEHVSLWVVTTGSRLHATCGLEDNPNVRLIKILSRVSFKRFDSFDRAAHPGYIEFYFRAKGAIRKILAEQSIELCHHLTPQSPRFPSPLLDCRIPYFIGPIHGGMQPPAVMGELGGKEDTFFLLRKLDIIRNRWDVLLRRTYFNAAKTVISAPYVGAVPPASYCNSVSIVPGTAVPLPSEYQRHDDRSGGPVRLIFAGRLVPSKGVELIIHALSRCVSKDLVVSIYGSGGLECYYKALAVDLGVDSRIHWCGFVSQGLVLSEYSKSDLFIFPSLKEPTGGAVLEAMAAGLPVICVDSGGPGYAVTEKTGIKIPLGSKEQMTNDLAAAIDQLAHDPGLRKEKGLNARMRIEEEFTWDAVVRKMLLLYRELV